MSRYTVNEIVADTKYSEFIYATPEGKVFVLQPSGAGAPRRQFDHEGETFTLQFINKYAPITTPRTAAAPKPVRPEIERTTVKGSENKTVLIYADGTEVIPTGGRPKLVNEAGSPLVEIRTVKAGGIKGKKGRAKLPVDFIEVMTNPRITYMYGDLEVPRSAILSGKGAPPKFYKGKTLDKVIRYVLSEDAPKPEVIPTEEEAKPTMTELGWAIGQQVKLKGSESIATVVVVKDYHIGIQYPGNKFIDTFNHKRLIRL